MQWIRCMLVAHQKCYSLALSKRAADLAALPRISTMAADPDSLEHAQSSLCRAYWGVSGASEALERLLGYLGALLR
eukprot:7151457-Pyramimonas_sp.AAC.1